MTSSPSYSRKIPEEGETWIDQFGDEVLILWSYARPVTDHAQIGPAHVVFSFERRVNPRDESPYYMAKEVRFIPLPEFMGTVRDPASVQGPAHFTFRYTRKVVTR